MRITFARVVVACTAVVALAATGWAQQTRDKDKDQDRDGGRHHQPAPAEAAVDFGVLPLVPIDRRPACRPERSAGPPIPVRTSCTT